MATLQELASLYGDGDLTNKISAAIVISVKAILDGGSPTAADRAYAGRVFANPKTEAKRILPYMLASRSAATLAQIQGATDEQIQTDVDAAVPIMILSDAGA